MSTPSDDRMSKLERRCRMLLRAYPAAYRSERGEEIIGTLLEATPPGRAWPRSRDLRSLLAGSLRARAAQNRERTTAANLRVAALAGIAAYVALSATSVLREFIRYQLILGWGSQFQPYPWPLAAGMILMLVAVALVWLSGRRGVVLCGALPAAAAISYAGPWGPVVSATFIAYLGCLAAMVALASGRCRPGWRWLLPVGLAAAVPLVPALAGVAPLMAVMLVLGAVAIAWIAVDARPALAACVFFMAEMLPIAIDNVLSGAGVLDLLPFLAIAAVIAAPVVWLLHRQSARPGRVAR
jgi:hypothetical protein